MKILVDADACPVKEIIIQVAKEYNIHVMMYVDVCHVINDGYSEVVTVDKSKDSVDIALANNVSYGDIVITQDYGVAAMVLAKGAKAMNQYGLVYTDGNIDKLLFERHISQKVRRSGGKTTGPRKWTKVNSVTFENQFRELVKV
ncbi:MAG: YaiI/YqxD family protein [Vulcanibacillus sp.]